MSRVLYRGTTEYLDIAVRANVSLSDPVSISFDRTTWIAAEWQGSEGQSRVARATVTDTDLPASGRIHDVFVKVEAAPIAPVLKAGTVRVL